MYTAGDSVEESSYQALYQFTGSAMKIVKYIDHPARKFGAYIGSTITKVKDNTITVKQSCKVPRIGNIVYSFNLKYAKGKLTRTSDVANISKYQGTTGYLKIKKNTTWYTSKACTKKKFSSLKKNTKAKAVQIYLKSNGYNIKIKTKSGATGWIKGSKKWSDAIIFTK